MARFLLKLEISLGDLLEEITDKVCETLTRDHDIELPQSSRMSIRTAVRNVLSRDIIQSDLCGFSVYCSENSSGFHEPEFDLKSDEN